jgi:hypothetical protein
MHRTFISMTWTSGVDEEDAQVMIRTIEDIYALLRHQFGKPGQFDPLPSVRVFGSWAIPSMPQDSAYANVQWYVRRSLDPIRRVIIGSRFMDTVVKEPWQTTSPHFDLAMTELNVLDDIAQGREIPALPGEPHALGVSSPGLFSLVTTHPFDEIESPELRKLALRHMVAHYFGVLMGIPLAHRADDIIIYKGRRYCANTCAMRFTDTPTLALGFAQQELAAGTIYCEACQRDLAGQVAGFHFGMN